VVRLQVEVFWGETPCSVVIGHPTFQRSRVKIEAVWTSETLGVLPQRYVAPQPRRSRHGWFKSRDYYMKTNKKLARIF
jgi:hypothetical protein